ncbi:kinase-like protein [Athelia psychrophila]|uniref:dual-specificity kinase n=1 Tax=Athelia psychrophila TaxID=1759441 RepID=A0A166SXW2_9AGAM|nr:kinase-like protein [Fibularhizoctonia sp. CBS 109695]
MLDSLGEIKPTLVDRHERWVTRFGNEDIPQPSPDRSTPANDPRRRQQSITQRYDDPHSPSRGNDHGRARPDDMGFREEQQLLDAMHEGPWQRVQYDHGYDDRHRDFLRREEEQYTDASRLHLDVARRAALGAALGTGSQDGHTYGTPPSSAGSASNMMSTEEAQRRQLELERAEKRRAIYMLPPSLLTSMPRSRSSDSQSDRHGSPSSSQQSLSTSPPVPSTIDEAELAGDKEMLHYIRRQQTKKMANGASLKELDDLLSLPDPIAPIGPVTPESILEGSQIQYLSAYERKEILDFPSVYYIGAKIKNKPATPDVTTNNFGFDDERGDYLIVNHDHLSYRYEVIDCVGKGSFGKVLQCRDHCTGQSVAIKIIRNKKRFHHQALVEIKILDNLRKWDPKEKYHVIKMTEHFYFRNHLCIATELLSINLHELIKANGFVGFTTALIRRFTSQILMSLRLMRHYRIVHCDLKPENIVLNHPAKSALKVIDFGSSCFEHEKINTYIQSRFYRSPEVILGMNYHMAIDIWSLGCILAELYTGSPIFPGENEQEQLCCIMEVLGTPDKDIMNRSSRKRLFFDSHGIPRPVVNSKGRRRRPGTKTLVEVLRCKDVDFIDLITRCLTWDPEKRIKPQQALHHPFITGGHRTKIIVPSPVKALPSSSSLPSSRAKQLPETPKESQIGAPTPLTSRISRTSTSAAVPSAPSTVKTASHASANVDHSLLRGPQEGWQGIDDEVTAKALRTLDWLSEKGSRVRSSIGGLT